MPAKLWRVSRGEHIIEARWSRWTLAGEILVDGQVIDSWGFKLSLRKRVFTVFGKQAIIQWPGVVSQCDLYLGGIKVRED